MSTELALAARCPACGEQCSGMASSRYPGLITMDYHLFPVRWLGPCIGSRSAGRPARKKDDHDRAT